MAIFKALKHLLFGSSPGEGGLRIAVGGLGWSSAYMALCLGPRPARGHPIDVDEGWTVKIIDIEVDNPAVAGSAIGTIPKGAQPLGCQMIVKTAGAAAGTSATLSVGITGTVGKYCTLGMPTQADSLAKNAKGKQLVDLDSTVLSADEAVKVFPAATGGTSGAGNSLTGAKVRVVFIYAMLESLKDYDA